jgi:hypothetical protein
MSISVIEKTSLVINMMELFQGKRDFNDDISKLNVINVTGVSYILNETLFTEDISGWCQQCSEHGIHVQ